MNNTIRYIIAGILIFLIILLQPIYLKWIGYGSGYDVVELDAHTQVFTDSGAPIEDGLLELPVYENNPSGFLINKESFITISTPLYIATLTSRSGGSFVDYVLTEKKSGELKYMGGYDALGAFRSDFPVSMIMPSTYDCMPCLAYFDDRGDKYHFINQPFSILGVSPQTDTLYLDFSDSIELRFVLHDDEGRVLVEKSVVFSADKYITNHFFKINDDSFDYSNNLEVLWYGGLRPTEENETEDDQYSSGIISQAGEIEDVQTNSSEESVAREVFKGRTDWVGVRTKYFISALIAENLGEYAVLSAENVAFGNNRQSPAYSAGIGYSLDITSIASNIYLGPLDVDHIAKTGTNLDAAMNWGFSLIRPISKGILWVLKFIHNTFNINYGLVLLLFAVLVRLITGPLTKKSYESSQNMQKIQPEIKKIQEKYKGDPQRLNRETMGLYKKHKVNPLGGCLPILLQMPLLWALFIVFRTTIEFRGAPFVLWISDLSKPDVVFNLPFSIPIYGSGVAVLPLVMGATLLLTMRISSASMEKSQKPVMYFMNGFFILLFNTFPSGLNLYYTAYNLLSFFQQRSIKTALSGK